MGFLFRLVFLYGPLAAIAALAAGLHFGIENRPAVAPAAASRPARIGGAERTTRLPAATGPQITLTAAQLDRLIAASLPASAPVRTESLIRPYGLVLAATVTLPAALGPLGRYVNLRAAVRPSRHGLAIARLAIGRIEIPAALARPVLDLALGLFAGPDGAGAIESIGAVAFADDRMTVTTRPAR